MQWSLSKVLLEQQLILFGRVARMPPSSVVRCAIFKPYSNELRVVVGRRRVGRPRQQWSQVVNWHAKNAVANNLNVLDSYFNNAEHPMESWRDVVRHYVYV